MKEHFVTTYSKYYSSGIYSARYNDNVSLRTYSAVKKLIEEAIISGNYVHEGDKLVIKIVDYGCGNGRYFETFKSIAESLKSKGILLEITGVDPVKKALKIYRKKLLARGFVEIEESSEPTYAYDDDNSVFMLSVLTSNYFNMRVRLIKNGILGDLANESRIIGPQNCGLCMFGVLSHIETRQRRQDTMHMLSAIVEGNTLYSLPNALRCFIDEQKIFGSRDIIYYRNDEIKLPYHLYTIEEIETDVASVRALIINGINSASIFDETVIMSNTLVNMLDFFISENMPLSYVEYCSKYFLFEVSRLHSDTKKGESCEYASLNEERKLNI